LGNSSTRWLNQHVLEIPIPFITSNNKLIVKKIESIVDKILKAKNQNSNAETSEYEKQIDQLVYKLYDLAPEEIEVIEKK